MNYISKFIRCLIILIIIFAIGIIGAPQTGEASEPVIIGVLHSENFTYATMMRNSYEMAIEVISREVGIKGRALELVYADDKGKRKAGEKAVRELVKKSNAVMLVGGAGGFTSHKFITMAGDAADNLLTATLWTPQLPYPGTKEYYNQYVKMYNVPPDYHGAEAYSVLLVAADALRRAESFSPESIRAALVKTDIITPFGPVKFKSYGKFER